MCCERVWQSVFEARSRARSSRKCVLSTVYTAQRGCEYVRQSRSTVSRVRNCVSPKALGAYERGSARCADTVTSLTKQSERERSRARSRRAVRNKNYVINKLFNYATLLLIPVSGISLLGKCRSSQATRRAHHRSRSHALVGQSNNMSVDSLKLLIVSLWHLRARPPPRAQRRTDARTAIPPPCRGATVTATLHETGGPEDRAPAPPAARARPQAARAFRRASSGLLGVKTQVTSVLLRLYPRSQLSAKNAQTETLFAMPFNDISTVHVFERLPMKGPS